MKGKKRGPLQNATAPFSNLFRLPARSAGEEKRELFPTTTTAKAAFIEHRRRSIS